MVIPGDTWCVVISPGQVIPGSCPRCKGDMTSIRASAKVVWAGLFAQLLAVLTIDLHNNDYYFLVDESRLSSEISVFC